MDDVTSYWTTKVTSKDEKLQREFKSRNYLDYEKASLIEKTPQKVLESCIAEATFRIDAETQENESELLSDINEAIDKDKNNHNNKKDPVNGDTSKLAPIRATVKPDVRNEGEKAPMMVINPKLLNVRNYPLLHPKKPLFVKAKKKNKVIYERPVNFGRFSSEAKSSKDLPSVSKILKATMPVESRLALQKWEERKVAEMGREAFDLMQKDTLKRGEKLHWYLQNHFNGETDSIVARDEDPILANLCESVEPVLSHLDRPLAIESHVVHPRLGYKGYLDCAAIYKKSHLVLIDWKTSERKKKRLADTFEAPLQLAAYVGAVNHDSNYSANINRAMLVVLYNDGSEASIFHMLEGTLNNYWGKWIDRINLYRQFNNMQSNNK